METELGQQAFCLSCTKALGMTFLKIQYLTLSEEKALLWMPSNGFPVPIKYLRSLLYKMRVDDDDDDDDDDVEFGVPVGQ